LMYQDGGYPWGGEFRGGTVRRGGRKCFDHVVK